MEHLFRETIEIATVKEMAKVLLGSEGKELGSIAQLLLDGVSAIPEGVFSFNGYPGRYAIYTPDGLVEVKHKDYILQTTAGQFYFIRLETVE